MTGDAAMNRDPLKRVVDLGAVPSEDGFQLVLVLGSGSSLTSEEELQTEDEAQLFADGHVDGLLGGAKYTSEAIRAFLSNPVETTTFEVPLDLSLHDKHIVKKGVLSGLALAAQGYWIDEQDLDSSMPTKH